MSAAGTATGHRFMASCGGVEAQPTGQPSGKATFVSRAQAGGTVSTSVRRVPEPAEAKLGAHRPGLGGKGLWWAGSGPLASPLPHIPALLRGVLPFSPTTGRPPFTADTVDPALSPTSPIFLPLTCSQLTTTFQLLRLWGGGSPLCLGPSQDPRGTSRRTFRGLGHKLNWLFSFSSSVPYFPMGLLGFCTQVLGSTSASGDFRPRRPTAMS